MIRRDYLLRMIDQCIQALAHSRRLIEEGQLVKAEDELEQTVRDLVGIGLEQVSKLSETELLGTLLRGEPTQVLRQKCLLLVALLCRAGEIQCAQGHVEQSRASYLKALDLQLDLLLREGPIDLPDFVPGVEVLVHGLEGAALPLRTSAALMRHYESIGQFARAEDILFDMLEHPASQAGLGQFGIQFYERLSRQSDEALELGNLPRTEVQAGLAELEVRFGKEFGKNAP